MPATQSSEGVCPKCGEPVDEHDDVLTSTKERPPKCRKKSQ